MIFVQFLYKFLWRHIKFIQFLLTQICRIKGIIIYYILLLRLIVWVLYSIFEINNYIGFGNIRTLFL